MDTKRGTGKSNGGWACMVGLCLLSYCHAMSVSGGRPSGPEQARPSRLFVHDEHEDAFEKQGYECGRCHLMDGGEATEVLSPAGEASCHACHVDRAENGGKDMKCRHCHQVLGPILPADHRAGWTNAHGARIASSKVKCAHCHPNRFCVRCHSIRDEAQPVFHLGSVLVTHPVEARANPAQCQKCHRYEYCARCHASGAF